MVISLASVPRLCGRPSVFGVKIVVVVVVAVVTAVMGGLGYSPGTALGVIVMVTTTALELGRRITADGGDSGVRPDRIGR
ncbi:hypothetical protein ACFWA6_19625 [Streptomyces sp. NPDC060020]|uniref:hypothetical protein n=1 Tax=Streptomyces sp. NPDC060020 TaxID=3347038 RepID=UPI0036A7B0AA